LGHRDEVRLVKSIFTRAERSGDDDAVMVPMAAARAQISELPAAPVGSMRPVANSLLGHPISCIVVRSFMLRLSQPIPGKRTWHLSPAGSA